MIRALILGQFSAIPWVPIMLGLARGLRAVGCEVFVVPLDKAAGDANALALELAALHEPDLVLVTVHHWERAALDQIRLALRTKLRSRWVAVAYDDPHDMLTMLDNVDLFDMVLTPERNALAVYAELGKRAALFPPVIDPVMHHAPTGDVQKVYDVLLVGGNWWTPRERILPAVREWAKGQRKVYAEVSGVSRWVVGRELTRALHATRLTLDIPRAPKSRTNPHGIACSYIGPRQMIAAATRTLCLVVHDEPHMAFAAMPRAAVSPLDVVANVELLLGLDADSRAQLLDRAESEFWDRYAPAVRGMQLVAECYAAWGHERGPWRDGYELAVALTEPRGAPDSAGTRAPQTDGPATPS